MQDLANQATRTSNYFNIYTDPSRITIWSALNFLPDADKLPAKPGFWQAVSHDLSAPGRTSYFLQPSFI
jgi:hypothetical protein